MSFLSFFSKTKTEKNSVLADFELDGNWRVQEKISPSDNGEMLCEWEFYDRKNRLRRKEVWTRAMYEDMHYATNLISIEVYHYTEEDTMYTESWSSTPKSSPHARWQTDELVVNRPIDPEWTLKIDRDDSLMNCNYYDKQNRLQRLEQWNMAFLGEDYGWAATLDNVFVHVYEGDRVINRRRTLVGNMEYEEWTEDE